MEKAYEPGKHENPVAQKWEKECVFQAVRKQDAGTKKAFTVPLPPPNVTGDLHLGHAMMLVVEDIMCRFHRMKGDATLWVPGTDHAAIATETVVLKNLGITNRDREISREKFLEECWKWTEKSHNRIVTQIKKMGASCDWTRERFTMDIGLSDAVNTIFYELHQAGLIYRGERMINWSVGAQSVLADDELVWEEREETFYHIKVGDMVVGTVRPETKCADSPVVVHPQDKRYKHLIGIKFEAETYAGKRKFHVLADDHIDPNFGTGAMTISTAHDAADFEMAKRHDLPFPRKIGFDGRMTELAGPCAGMTVMEARKKSSEIMKKKGLIVKTERYRHRVPLCYRTNTVVEPMISRQWFIDVNKEFQHPVLRKKTTLKKLTAEAVRNGDVKIVPKRFEKIYFQWIDNLRDWCISRQIWWGHRIPVWHEKEDVETRHGASEKQTKEARIHLMRKQNLIFMRHAESESNAQDMIAGSENNVNLTSNGKKQALELAKKLKQEKTVRKIIASTLSRSQQTAEIIARELGVEIEVWKGFQEIDAGEASGTSCKPRETCRERIMSAKHGESAEKIMKRAQDFWKKVQNIDPPEGDILFIGHGAFIAAVFAARDGISAENWLEYWKRWHFDNCETREITFMIPPKGEKLKQDQDTLDTWFSSALWPFSTLGWPDSKHPDFRDFFPTSVLETGHDILFFWVARMIMFSLFATGKPPFHTVYLHGLVCDESGQKMSKSKGNGIDPLKMIEKFGTDALRMSMIVGTTPGNQVNLGEKKVESYRNFANKLWNVFRYFKFSSTGQSLDGALQGLMQKKPRTSVPKNLVEKYIVSKAQRLITEVTKGLEHHRYGEMGQKLYEFTWNDLADWAIEFSKVESCDFQMLQEGVLKPLLKLLHPYVPFVTEKLWERFTREEPILATAQWPKANKNLIDTEAEQDVEFLKTIITKIRSLRSEKKIEPAKLISVHFSGKNKKVLRENEKILRMLARLQSIEYDEKSGEGVSAFVSGTEVFLPLDGMIDADKEKIRLQKELSEAKKLLENLENRLGNKKYVQNAPAHLVKETKAQHVELQERIKNLENQLKKY